MKEEFLYYLWRHQFFTKKELKLATGELLEVIDPGYRNQFNGPDFKESHIVLDGIHWYGSVEMHVKSSDWLRHGHYGDPHFDNVILHVVFINDQPIINPNGQAIATFEVKGAYKPKVYHRYMNLIENPGKVPCAQQIQTVAAITRLSMLEAALIQRLERKSYLIKEDLEATQYDWQEVTFRKLAEGLGFKTNAAGMKSLAELVSLKLLQKQSSLLKKEALLLGQVGFLNGQFKDEYVTKLQQEYGYLKAKYGLTNELDLHAWKFAPLRPYNYPTYRLAQLAALVHGVDNLWDVFLTYEQTETLFNQLQVETSSYWKEHFRPDKTAQVGSSKLSKNAYENLMINVAAPLLVAFGQYADNDAYTDKALNLLSALKPEQNRITKLWRSLDWRISSAFDSQALNELYSQYCQNRRCLDCKIGHQLIRSES